MFLCYDTLNPDYHQEIGILEYQSGLPPDGPTRCGPQLYDKFIIRNTNEFTKYEFPNEYNLRYSKGETARRRDSGDIYTVANLDYRGFDHHRDIRKYHVNLDLIDSYDKETKQVKLSSKRKNPNFEEEFGTHEYKRSDYDTHNEDFNNKHVPNTKKKSNGNIILLILEKDMIYLVEMKIIL